VFGSDTIYNSQSLKKTISASSELGRLTPLADHPGYFLKNNIAYPYIHLSTLVSHCHSILSGYHQIKFNFWFHTSIVELSSLLNIVTHQGN